MKTDERSLRSEGRKRGNRRIQQWVAAAAVAFLLYMAVGFFVVPMLVRTVLVNQVEARLNAGIEVESISFNPLTLRMRTEGLVLRESDGAPVLRLAEGSFALSLRSVYRFAPVLREVTLREPWLEVVQESDGSINLFRLPKFDEHADPETIVSPFELDLPRLAIRRLTLSDGRVDLRDETLTEAFVYTLSPFSFSLNEFSTFAEDGNRLAFSGTDLYGGSMAGSGSFSFSPLTMRFELNVRAMNVAEVAPYLRSFMPVDLRHGQLEFELIAELDGHRPAQPLKVAIPRMRLVDLGLYPAESGLALMDIKEVVVTGTLLRGFDLEIEVDRVRIGPGTIRAIRHADGGIDWLNVIGGMEAAEGPVTPGWGIRAAPRIPRFLMREVAMKNFGFEVLDHSVGGGARLSGVVRAASLGSLSNDFSRPVDFALEIAVMEEGTIEADGEISLDPLAGDAAMRVTGFPLALLSPWAAAFADLEVVSGTGALSGTLTATPGLDGMPLLSFAGETEVQGFASREGGNDLAAFERFSVGGMHFDSAPLQVRAESVRVDRPTGFIALEADGRLNLQRVFRMDPAALPSGDERVDAIPEEAPDRGQSERFPVAFSIGRLEVEDGRASVHDASVSPEFATTLDEIRVRLHDIDSESETPATLDLSGRFPNAAHLEITGEIGLLGGAVFGDIDIRMNGFDLPPVSGYSGRYLGRAFARGNMDMEIAAQVENDAFSAKSSILVRELQLGERVDSPDAVNLPLDLAVALLRNQRGEISLDIPLSGRIADPEFSVAGIVSQSVATVLGSIVRSPFSILGGIVGTEPDRLERVEFLPGRAILDTGQEETLRALAEALHQRPELTLEAQGVADPASDRSALAELRLQEQLARHRDLIHEDDPTASGLPAEDPRVLRSYYAHQFGEPGALAARPVESLETPASNSGVADSPAAKSDPKKSSWIRRVFRVLFGSYSRDTTPEAQDEKDVRADDADGVADPSPSDSAVPETLEEGPTLAEMRARLLDSIVVSDEELHRLARARAVHVRDALIATNRLESHRISIGSVRIDSGSVVRFELR